MNNIKPLFAKVDNFFSKVITIDKLFQLFWIFILIGILFMSFKILRSLVMNVTRRKCNAQVQYAIDKVIHYTGIVVIIMTLFNRLGVNFSGVLGAAGIAGIAVGFAAQTSVSNVISGVFVMTERAFNIGDLLQVDSIIGEVVSIDFLSIRLKTLDNQLVRIPNETVIKTNLINITHYPIRRVTLNVGVSYGTDLRKVREILLTIAAKNEFALSDPVPLVIFDALNDSDIGIIYGVWAKKEHFLELKNSIIIELLEGFAAEEIKIPYPQIGVHINKV